MRAISWLWRMCLVAGLVTAVLAVAPRALADDEPQAFARVVVDSADLRTGPGVSYRVIYNAHRGETLALDGRPGTGFWLRVILPDGRAAYVLGDEIQPFAVNPAAEGAPRRPGLFAPPPLEGSRVGFSIVGGLLITSVLGETGAQHYGYMEARPQVVIHKTVTLDGFLGAAETADGTQFMYGVGATVYFAPDWPVCPFVGIGGGGLSIVPVQDSFIRQTQQFMLGRAGGGLLLALRGRILMRFEVTNLSIFTADSYKNAQTFSGGFGVYF